MKKQRSGTPNIILPKSNMDGYNFSFSGIKTAVLNLYHKNPEINIPDLCASFQECVTEMLLEKTNLAKKELGIDKIVLAGGVSANSYIRKRFENADYPTPILCTDNAAMIAAARIL